MMQLITQRGTLIALCLLLTGCSGCQTGYRGTRIPLQPGDQILFRNDGTNRASEFRIRTANDPVGTNPTTVTITQPTTLLTE